MTEAKFKLGHQLDAVKQEMVQAARSMEQHQQDGKHSTYPQQLAAAQQLVKAKEADLAAAARQEEDLQQQNALLLQLEEERMALQERLEAAQHHKGSLQELVFACESAKCPSENLQQQQHALQKMEEGSRMKEKQQEQTLKQAARVLQQLQQQYASADQAVAACKQQQEQARLAAAAAAAASSTAPPGHSLPSAQEQLQSVTKNVQQLQQEVLQAQAQHAAYLHASSNHQMQALQVLLPPSNSHQGSKGAAARAKGFSAQSSGSNASSAGLAGVAPLQRCFRVKDAGSPQVQALVQALAAICGPGSLDTLVVPSSDQVGEILQAVNRQQGRAGGWSHGKLRLWPLDSLSCTDRTAAQQAAQQKLGRDKVIMPLKLFEYPPQAHVAMVRAFGSYVIAADDGVADALIKQFGLSSVTPQGTLSHKGSMTGGWMGAAAGGPTVRWKLKMQQDAAALELEASQHRLQQQLQQQGQLELLVQKLQQQAAEAEAVQEKLMQLHQEAEELARKVVSGQRQLDSAKLLHAQLKQEHDLCLSRLQQFDQSSIAAAANGPQKKEQVTEESVLERLQQDLVAAASQELKLETKLEATQEKVCGGESGEMGGLL